MPRYVSKYRQLLSEMAVTEEFLESGFTAETRTTSMSLELQRQKVLLELSSWFHHIQESACRTPPVWLTKIVKRMKYEKAQIISFNWDLVLDERLFGGRLCRSSYGVGDDETGPRLIKPHGSLNWFEYNTGKNIKDSKKIPLLKTNKDQVYAFTRFRAPSSSRRTYMPTIIPPVYTKNFRAPLFGRLWGQSLSVLCNATHVIFLGYSLPVADFHARFMLRNGFYNQENGGPQKSRSELNPKKRARVTIVDPDEIAAKRIEDTVGWKCEWHKMKIEDWVELGLHH